MQTIITTTGTSLLTNVARELKKDVSSLTDTDSVTVTDNELKDFFKKVEPTKASAEIHSLLKIAPKLDDEVVLLYTSTKEGEWCAKEVEQYLQKKQNLSNIRLRQLSLDYNEAEFERRGLRELVNILVEEISNAQRRQRDVIINATGGFKAEIAYTTMVGMVFQVPVKYIYQQFKQLITFPSLPIAWNIDLLLEYDHFFEWIDEDCRQQTEVEQRLKAIDEADRHRIEQLLLPPDSEGEVFLSPAGDILWKRVRHQKEVAERIEEAPPSNIDIADKIAESLKKDKHHYPNGTLSFSERVAQLPPVEEIIGGHFENTTMRRIKKIEEDGIIRVLWADNNKAVNMTIRTTARGQLQTMKFYEHYIRPLLK
jgi:putative CRISPR-associated protein (TIGR02619 family)